MSECSSLAKFVFLIITISGSAVSVMGMSPSNAEAQSTDSQHLNGPPVADATPPIHIKKSATTTPTGLFPVNVKRAYGIDQITCPQRCGTGQVIAIVDAFAYPSAAKDLNAFSSQFGLPRCTVASGCLTIHKMGLNMHANANWAIEQALDLQWAHAVAPGAKLLLVEAKSASITDLLAAVDYANNYPGVHQVSMSWGAGEFSGESSYDSYFQHSNITYFASTGDSGTGVEWPSVSTHVIAVGGTTLTTLSDGTFASETAWSGSGGGISKLVPKPSYQTNFNTAAMRAVPDVSYDADPNTGFPVYDSYQALNGNVWYQVGGTSAGSPQWAGLFAIANQLRAMPLTTSDFSAENLVYGAAMASYSTSYHDIISGTNGVCGFVCSAQVGFDEVTGIGTPQAKTLVSYLTSH